jgi:hypothetical protein
VRSGAVVLVVVLLGGCLDQGSDPLDPSTGPVDETVPLAFLPSTNVTVPCGDPCAAAAPCAGGCFEPAVAVGADGRIYAAAHRVDGVMVSSDGGATFTHSAVPYPDTPTPQYASGASDDVVQVAPWGWVYYHELWSDTGGIAGGGIHIAASEDGGVTWPLNVFVHVREMPLSRSFTADRQWLAFDGDSTVYLVFNCGLSSLICAMRSDDRGVTWSPSTNVVTPVDHTFPSPAGFPAVGPDGTILVAYFADPRPDTSTGARSIKVASSTDQGQTWRQSTAYTHAGLDEGTAGGGWPEATILVDGTWVAGWSTSDDRLWFTTSSDQGATWGEPVILLPEETGGASHPWMRPRQDGGFDAVWFGQGPSVVLGRFSTNLSYELASMGEGGGESDYSFFDHTPDDRVAVVFVRPDGGLSLVLSNR